jgi:S-adenosylmethionine:tRNA ribosyltransferase-isomerase
VDDLDQHVMHSEWLNVGAELVEQIRRTREAGGACVAVGTTVVRALESATRVNDGRERELQPFAGETRCSSCPGYRIVRWMR